jgi:hypothetical protein
MSTLVVGCGQADDAEPPASEVTSVSQAAAVPEGSLYQIRLASSGKCAAVAGSSTADGAKIVQQPCSASAANDRLDLVNVSGDTYQVRPTNSGKCIVVPSGTGSRSDTSSTSGSGGLVQRRCEGGDNELFRGQPVNGGIRVQSVATGRCVGAANSSDGTQFTRPRAIPFQGWMTKTRIPRTA